MTLKFNTGEKRSALWEKYFFDKEAALRVVRFIEKYCVHVEDGINTRTSEPVVLARWQRLLIIKFFGWRLVSDGRRKFKTLWLEIPRKNGKTTILAWLILYLLFADGERGAQIVCAASDTDQASIIFDICKSIVEASPKLSSTCKIYKRSLFIINTRSVFRVISGTPRGKHGKNLHALCVDEVHEQEGRELIDALKTSNIARRQPVELYATTAGDNMQTICGEMHDYAVSVSARQIKDDTFLAKIYCADPKKWQDEREWFKANPNLGVTFELQKMRDDFELARQVPAYENTFKRLRLNIWTEQEHRAIPMDAWKKCVHLRPKESLRKQECFMGLDLSSTTDISSAVLAFPPRGERTYWDTLSFFWYPELNIELRKKRAKADLTPWGQSGLIKFTDGNVIDYDVIREDINALSLIYNIREIAIDRWNSSQLATQLSGDGREVVLFGQGYASMSDPTKFMLGLVLSGKLNHDGNEVLTWMANNLAVETNSAGDIKPSKKLAREKIDGIVALVMAISRGMVAKSSIESQITRGLIVASA